MGNTNVSHPIPWDVSHDNDIPMDKPADRNSFQSSVIESAYRVQVILCQWKVTLCEIKRSFLWRGKIGIMQASLTFVLYACLAAKKFCDTEHLC